MSAMHHRWRQLCAFRSSKTDAAAESTGSGHVARSGQAIVEFALIATAFFMIIFGTIDFGRAVFLNAELHNAVRDATREAKREIANGSTGPGISQSSIQNRVRNAQTPDGTNAEHPRPGLGSATASYTCSAGCTSGSKLTVTASVPFAAFTQDLLGIDPITLSASSTVTLE